LSGALAAINFLKRLNARTAQGLYELRPAGIAG
jgi:hypothetical protein